MAQEHPTLFDCHDRKLPDEPSFTLLARDPEAPETVRSWARRRLVRLILDGVSANAACDQVSHAFTIASDMERWRRFTPPETWRNGKNTT